MSRRRAMLQLALDRGRIDVAAVRATFGVAMHDAARDLYKLRTWGLLEQIGGPGRHARITSRITVAGRARLAAPDGAPLAITQRCDFGPLLTAFPGAGR